MERGSSSHAEEMRHRLYQGMLVRGRDGRRLGRVVDLREDDLVIEKGFLFRRRFTAGYEEIDRVEVGGPLILSWEPTELPYLPERELGGRRFTDTGEKEIATGIAEERRRPVRAPEESGRRR